MSAALHGQKHHDMGLFARMPCVPITIGEPMIFVGRLKEHVSMSGEHNVEVKKMSNATEYANAFRGVFCFSYKMFTRASVCVMRMHIIVIHDRYNDIIFTIICKVPAHYNYYESKRIST